MRITEDGVWRHFNCPDPHWSEKCRSCREGVARIRSPVPECLNCWKVEVWSLGTTMRQFRGVGEVPFSTYAVEQDYLVGALMQRGYRVIAKASRAPILVVRSGVPLEAYPSEETDCLLILYARNIAERDELRSAAEAVLGSVGSAGSGGLGGLGGAGGLLGGREEAAAAHIVSRVALGVASGVALDPGAAEDTAPCSSTSLPEHVLPIRRGCWRYDDVLGPWETWYPPDRDFTPDEAGAKHET